MNDFARCLGARDQRGTLLLCADCKRLSPPLSERAWWIAPAAKEVPVGKRAVSWSCMNKVKV